MLRPIDMTLTIQHAADAHRAGANDAQGARSEVQAQMFADRLDKQTREQMQQVHQPNQNERANVNPDGRGPAGKYTPRKGASKKKPQEGSRKQNVGQSLFDVSI